jgi:tetratricopeptide (TPR) repeat protein
VFQLLLCFGLVLNSTGTPLELGLAALKQERVQAAAYYFGQVVADDSGNSLAWLRLAEANIDLGRLREAESAYRKSLEGDSTGQASRIGLAVLLADFGRTDESVQLLEEALRADPDFGPAHLEMALLLEKLDKPDQAREHYSKAIAAGVKDPRAFYRLSIILAQQGGSREALTALGRAFELAPERYVARVVNSMRKVRNEFEPIRYLPEFAGLLEEYKKYWPEPRSAK